MPGDTPQPGETPRSGADPWSLPDPDAAWWRGETDRPADEPARRRLVNTGPEQPASSTGVLLPPAAGPRTGEAAEGHEAGVRDTADELTSPAEKPPAPVEPPSAPVENIPAVERNHDQPDPHRYTPLRPAAGYTARRSAETVAADAPEPPAAAGPAPAATEPQPSAAPQPVSAQRTPVAPQSPAAPQSPVAPPSPGMPHSAAGPRKPDSTAATPQSPAAQQAAAASPDGASSPAGTHRPKPKAEVTPPPDDVMVLPEPNLHHRPTVPLDHPMPMRPRQAGGAHTRPTEPLPRATGSPATDARLQRLENSAFWRDPVDDTIEVKPGQEPPPALTRARHRSPGRARPKPSGRPLSAQVSLVALGLVAAFFAWVSAEPFWLAVGHGDQGYVTTTQCTGEGVTQRCAGRFASADGRYTITQVRLLGVEGQARLAGTVTPARMVSPDSRQAYVGGTGALLQLRWMLGFALVLLCGYAIAGVTKARRLETARARRGAVLLSLAGPLALLAGFLAAAY
ncbi:hypothetical protein Aab01nite_24340 [Paractinoplanes abujensis]|uniref:Uncharacterized protein n=1 Tax=Paractinoplanes abujensis TaxID=882441 RepID=A0A7W7D0H4_9ACTN|nr:hypothetical protein [Actinoplanes abujensis]MBB4696693.1 hypothetical protein [Actinoplanes abujensis]GID18844.1 hypothetical protein Aab01nite_24340 [Actinoplanes abujensis]